MNDESTPMKPRVRDAEGLTHRQRQVLDTVRVFVKTNGLPPSRSELSSHLGIMPNAVNGHLRALETAGWLETYPSVERGIRLLREGAALYEDPGDLPELNVPPARRRWGTEKREPPRVDSFDSFAKLFEARPDLLLRIKDDSMEDAGYRPGAIVAVVRGLEPRDGDVVVARVDGTALVRRYRGRDAETIELRPESSNPKYEPVQLRQRSAAVEIVGVVVGQIVAARGGVTNNRKRANETD